MILLQKKQASSCCLIKSQIATKCHMVTDMLRSCFNLNPPKLSSQGVVILPEEEWAQWLWMLLPRSHANYLSLFQPEDLVRLLKVTESRCGNQGWHAPLLGFHIVYGKETSHTALRWLEGSLIGFQNFKLAPNLPMYKSDIETICPSLSLTTASQPPTQRIKRAGSRRLMLNVHAGQSPLCPARVLPAGSRGRWSFEAGIWVQLPKAPTQSAATQQK